MAIETGNLEEHDTNNSTVKCNEIQRIQKKKKKSILHADGYRCCRPIKSPVGLLSGDPAQRCHSVHRCTWNDNVINECHVDGIILILTWFWARGSGSGGRSRPPSTSLRSLSSSSSIRLLTFDIYRLNKLNSLNRLYWLHMLNKLI